MRSDTVNKGKTAGASPLAVQCTWTYRGRDEQTTGRYRMFIQ